MTRIRVPHYLCLPLALGLALTMGCGDDEGPDSGDAGLDDAAVEAAAASDCSDAPLIPARVESDLTVGPGCARLNRTEVREGAVLTIAEGTLVLVEPAGFLNVSALGSGAALKAIGTAAAPIRFTSSESTPQAGDWQCIRFGAASSSSELRHVVLEYGGQPCEATGADFEATLDVAAAARAISNVTVRNSQNHGILIQNDAQVREFENNTFGDNGQPSIKVHASSLLALGAPNTFEDSDDYIEIDTTFSLSTTGTWRAQSVPYRSVGTLDVRGNATVTIEAGTEIQMTGGSFDVFTAAVRAEGTAGNEVKWTSADPSPAAGAWGCIAITNPSGNSTFDHVVIEYAGNGDGCTGANRKGAMLAPSTTTVTNTEFKDPTDYAIVTTDRCDDAAGSWCGAGNTFGSPSNATISCRSYLEERDC